MVNKLLVVRSMEGQPVAGGQVASDLKAAGVPVEQTLSTGVITPTEGVRVSTLEEMGYRVWVLKNTEIISIGKYKINIARRLPRIPNPLRVPASLRRQWPHHLLQLVASPEVEWIQAIQDRGIRVVETIPPYGLYVIGAPAEVEALKSHPAVAWTGLFEPAYRVSERLSKMRGTIDAVNIGILSDGDIEAVRAAINAAGGKILIDGEKDGTGEDTYVTLVVELPARAINKIARLPDVRWMDYHPKVILMDERSCQILAGDVDETPPPNTLPNVGYADTLTDLDLSGAGVTVSICDTGVDTNDNATMQGDLAGRLTFFIDLTDGAFPVDTFGHGTHVAAIAVGNGATGDKDPQTFLLGAGVAPGANFGSINGILSSIAEAEWVRESTTHGASVMNNSWGAGVDSEHPNINVGYTHLCRTFDLLARDPDDATAELERLVLVGAAGNYGSALRTIIEPWEAKNAIVVGASLNARPGEGDNIDDIRGLRPNSSRGPAVDGRYLPTVLAPGTDITSARPTVDSDPSTPGVQRPKQAYTDTGGTIHNDHYSGGGTSAASPHVAGTCALLIEWWRRDHAKDRTPSPALLKALLVNGAVDVAGGPNRRGGNIANIPNNDQGWGRVCLKNMFLQAPCTDRGPKIFMDQRHAFTGSNQEYLIRVAAKDEMRPMRLTLVWSDAAAPVDSNPALINNLNLEVTELATGNVFKGNFFVNGFSAVGGEFNLLDNVECVYVQNPQGIYEVRVLAQAVIESARPDIATPWQDFAFVLDNVEIPNAAPVSIVPVIDRSTSMVFSGYVDITRAGSKQFVDNMSVDDKLAVVSFGTTGAVEYPTGSSPSLQRIQGQTTRDAANFEIENINFGGCTFMGDGIEKAANLLSSAPIDQRAIVLLSDGYDNKGCDVGNAAKPSALDAAAALPSDVPIYTCAMGRASDQVLLEQLATDTDGRYYYMPTIDDLFEIYNYIRGQVSSDSIIINDTNAASQSRVSGYVDGCARRVTFSVAWFDSSLKYVARAPKKHNEISVRLRNPNNHLLHNNATDVFRIVGDGYVVFKIDDPMPGRWYVEVETERTAHTRYTVGGFVDSPLKLILPAMPKVLPVNSPLSVVAQVVHEKDTVLGVKVKTVIVAPTTGIDKVFTKYARELAGIRPDKKLSADVPLDIAKLMTLRRKMQKDGGKDILDHHVNTVAMAERSVRSLKRMGLDYMAGGRSVDAGALASVLGATVPRSATGQVATVPPGVVSPVNPLLGSGFSIGQLDRVSETGTYNVLVRASGFSPKCNSRFTRLQMASVLAKSELMAKGGVGRSRV